MSASVFTDFVTAMIASIALSVSTLACVAASPAATRSIISRTV